ncbi:MAG: glycosyltransferase family 4 protein [Thermodesulfovibrionales bacterium]
MKIGVNATFLGEKPTGLGVFTQEISRYLSAVSRDFVVFSSAALEGVPEDFVYRVPPSIRGSLRFRDNLLRFVYLNLRLPLLCRNKKIDVLFCPMIEFPFLPLVPLVVHIHDLHPILFSAQFRRAAAHFRYSLKRLEKVAGRVTVSSAAVKKELLAATGIREEIIDVVPLAYSRDRFYPQGPEGRNVFFKKYSLRGRYILTVGNLFPYKNIDSLVEAFLTIKDKVPHSLVIVGRKEYAAGRPLNDERILYTDYVPDEDLPKFYSYADLLVHPSLSEGFGLTPLEAMACGTPVISSTGGSLKEVIGDSGMFFEPADTGSMGRLIVRVLGDEGLRKRLVEKGFAQTLKFSWEKTAAGIMESCRKALEEKQ